MLAYLNKVVAVLVAVGAINWGLVGLLNLNVVEQLAGLLGAKELISRVVYVLIGIAGVLALVHAFKPDFLFN